MGRGGILNILFGHVAAGKPPLVTYAYVTPCRRGHGLTRVEDPGGNTASWPLIKDPKLVLMLRSRIMCHKGASWGRKGADGCLKGA